jgi:tetratricopeptide (TPR) repeat protein
VVLKPLSDQTLTSTIMQNKPSIEQMTFRDWVGGALVAVLFVLLVYVIDNQQTFLVGPRTLFEQFLQTEDRKLQEELIGQIVANEPDSALGHYAKGWLANEQSDFVQAASEYREALKLDPKFAEAYNGLGVAYLNQEDEDAAIESFRKALELSPNLIHARINLALAYFEQGQIDEAIRENERALVINPDIAEVHFNLALGYQARHQFARAIEEYQNALRINPRLAQAYFNLAALQEQNGDKTEALKNYRSFLNVSENEEEFAEQRLQAVSRIDELEREIDRSLFGEHPAQPS